jgi:hypothetical protein
MIHRRKQVLERADLSGLNTRTQMPIRYGIGSKPTPAVWMKTRFAGFCLPLAVGFELCPHAPRVLLHRIGALDSENSQR